MYSTPLTVAATTTVKVMAAAGGYANSAPVSATYTIAATPPAPAASALSPAADTYTIGPDGHSHRHHSGRGDLLHHERLDSDDCLDPLQRTPDGQRHGHDQCHRRRRLLQQCVGGTISYTIAAPPPAALPHRVAGRGHVRLDADRHPR